MLTTDIHLEFPDERSRKDFEICFKGWLNEWQTQRAILRRLTTSTVAADEIKDPTSSGLVAGEPHHLGVDPGAPAGLVTIDDLVITIGDTTIDIGGLYLNIIPFF